MYCYGIITISDSSAANQRIDKSGSVIQEVMGGYEFQLKEYTVIPDEQDQIINQIIYFADKLNCNLILTTGGTGFSKRDITPEATQKVIERHVPGVSEAIRVSSMAITDRAMLSRGICGIRGDSVILNLPGSPKAVKESLEIVIKPLIHGIDILTGQAIDCAKTKDNDEERVKKR